MAGLVEVIDDGAGGTAAGVSDGGAPADGKAGGAGDPATGADGSGDANGGGAVAERPDFIPETAWDPEKGYDKAKHLEALRAETRPESADAYTLPDIDGFDKETAGKSPLVAALRKSAHAAGLDQGGFESAISEYVAESVRVSQEQHDAAMAALGDNAKTRTDAIGRWLGANLPKDQANAIAASLTSAEAIIGFEQIMSGGSRRTSGGDPPPSTTRKSRAEIESMMNTKAYHGKAAERDPAVIAEVDNWFKEEAKAKK